MKNILKKTMLCLGMFCMVGMLSAKPTEAEEVREIIDKVNTYWQTHNKPEVRSFWDNAAYHTGNMEAYFLTGNETYRAYSEAWAKHNEWKGAKIRLYNAYSNFIFFNSMLEPSRSGHIDIIILPSER